MGSKSKNIIFCFLGIWLLPGLALSNQKKVDKANTQILSANPTAKTTSEITEEFLKKVKEQEKPMAGVGSTAKAISKPDVTVYFFWASWCEYCEEGYNALTELQSRLEGKNIEFKACNFDASMDEAVLKKANLMKKITHYAAPMAIVKSYPEFQRLPIFIAEDNRNGRVVANTGFSKERFRYFSKNINRMLNEGVSDEE